MNITFSSLRFRFNELARLAGLTQGSQQVSDNTKETYLNQDLAVSLLLENQTSLKRCELVSTAFSSRRPNIRPLVSSVSWGTFS